MGRFQVQAKSIEIEVVRKLIFDLKDEVSKIRRCLESQERLDDLKDRSRMKDRGSVKTEGSGALRGSSRTKVQHSQPRPGAVEEASSASRRNDSWPIEAASPGAACPPPSRTANPMAAA